MLHFCSGWILRWPTTRRRSARRFRASAPISSRHCSAPVAWPTQQSAPLLSGAHDVPLGSRDDWGSTEHQQCGQRDKCEPVSKSHSISLKRRNCWLLGISALSRQNLIPWRGVIPDRGQLTCRGVAFDFLAGRCVGTIGLGAPDLDQLTFFEIGNFNWPVNLNSCFIIYSYFYPTIIK